MDTYDERRQKRQEQIKKMRLAKASFMNDSKWTKFFQAVQGSDMSLHGESMKVLGSDYISPFSLKNHGLYWVRGYTADAWGGPCAYREIEWIFVPAMHEVARYNRDEQLMPKRQANDIHALKELIDSLGQFEYDLDEKGLKIYGYK
ncbi:MAG: hypothetical protein FWE12_04530 [Oscillospiraceae bacterium]|nr:hypothetical protein [Oscillospiraceae bacterium]